MNNFVKSIQADIIIENNWKNRCLWSMGTPPDAVYCQGPIEKDTPMVQQDRVHVVNAESWNLLAAVKL